MIDNMDLKISLPIENKLVIMGPRYKVAIDMTSKRSHYNEHLVGLCPFSLLLCVLFPSFDLDYSTELLLIIFIFNISILKLLRA